MADRTPQEYQEKAVQLWSGFSQGERQLVTIGVFPNGPMTDARRDGFREPALAVALMAIQRANGQPRFRLGKVVATPGALDLFERTRTSAHRFLARHLHADWGDLDDEDKKANDAAVIQSSRILSAYLVADEKLWVITEADRSSTCLLLPSEY
jgi:hypothetical protein